MSNLSASKIDSIALCQVIWRVWRIVGIVTHCKADRRLRYLWRVYDILINLMITICYPLHLIAGLFLETTSEAIFKNLSINITCLACTVKHWCLRYNAQRMQEIEMLLQQLDLRIQQPDEVQYFQRIIKPYAVVIRKLFIYAATAANVAATLIVLLSTEPRLMYPAWLPFDWHADIMHYRLAVGYQFVGVTIQIVQNLANDIYPPLMLCIFAGHVRLLALRVTSIGHAKAHTLTANNLELIHCIEDHRKLIKIFDLLQDTISFVLLTQFVSAGLSFCIVLIYLIYYVDNIYGYIYYSVYFFAMGLEIFPSCYFGTVLNDEFNALTYALFSCNWLEQEYSFRRNICIFTELTLRSKIMLAGGIIGIHLDSFFATVKMAYSLFAVVLNMK